MQTNRQKCLSLARAVHRREMLDERRVSDILAKERRAKTKTVSFDEAKKSADELRLRRFAKEVQKLAQSMGLTLEDLLAFNDMTRI